jgi:hypothetical protein
MRFNVAALGAAFSFGAFLVDAFDANSNANMAVYYGQNSRNVVGAQSNLAAYCQGTSSSFQANIDSTLDV